MVKIFAKFGAWINFRQKSGSDGKNHCQKDFNIYL